MPHSTVTIDHQGQPVTLDVGIAPLVKALWARGISTVSSCEAIDTMPFDCGAPPPGLAYVAFRDGHDARRFARTCSEGRAVDPRVMKLDPVAPEDLAHGDSFGIEVGTVMVLFPADRIAAVTCRLDG